MAHSSSVAALTRAIRANNAQAVHRVIEQFGPGILEHRRSSDSARPLHIALAARPFHREMVQVLLDLGSDPNAPDGRGQRPLHYLERDVHEGCAQALIAAGADPQKTDRKHLRALHGLVRADALDPVLQALADTPRDEYEALLITAAGAGAERVLATLLELGVSASARNPKRERATALIRAAQGGHTGCAHRLIRAGADLNPISEGRGALGHAAAGGHVACLALLLDAGTPPNGTPRGGEPPLVSAARAGHAGAVQCLLDSGADPLMPDRRGALALHAATVPGHSACVRLLLEAGSPPNAKTRAGCSALSNAIASESLETVILLTDAGAEINAWEGVRNVYPLMLAAQRGCMDIVEHLLSCGANPNCRLDSVDPPLLCFARRANLPGVGLLLAYGADPNIADASGFTPLHALSHALSDLLNSRHPETALAERAARARACADALLSQGADPNARSSRGQTPLHAATSGLAPDLVVRLLEAGADPMAADVKGDTPLHTLAQGSVVTFLQAGQRLNRLARPCLDALAEHGADFEARNHAGETPDERYRHKSLSFLREYAQAQRTAAVCARRGSSQAPRARPHGAEPEGPSL